LCIAAVAIWLGWTLRHASRNRTAIIDERNAIVGATASVRDVIALACLLVPMGAYVYGAMAWGWGFNELSAGFLAGGIAGGLVGGLTLERTAEVYLDGMKGLLSAAILVGVARSISLVLEDGHVVDTMLNALATPLGHGSPAMAALLMVPFHVLVHIPVSSVSGHAVLTMPVIVPLSDLVGVPRLAAVMAYQIGGGLTELLTPTNGSMMAILLAAGLPFDRWIRFALVGVALVAVLGVVGMLAVIVR
jgi:uncharacterized ion transporter superfamily protein YfcC